MSQKSVIQAWVNAFNRYDANALAALYAPDAVNHQVSREPLIGRDAIRQMFEQEFSKYIMVCEVEQILEDHPWVILEWRDPNGLRGCGFFKIEQSLIVYQRGYFDSQQFLTLQGK